MVFDRWGELVHSTQNFPASSLDPSHGWDGSFQGKNVNPGVYVYYENSDDGWKYFHP